MDNSSFICVEPIPQAPIQHRKRVLELLAKVDERSRADDRTWVIHMCVSLAGAVILCAVCHWCIG